MEPDRLGDNVNQTTFWGVGPSIGATAAIHFAVMLVIDRMTAPMFQIERMSFAIALTIGVALITLGIILYLLSLFALLKARRDRQLITTGPYRLIRHPLYAIGLFFVCPGFCLFFRSLLVLTTPLAMAAAFWFFIRREEKVLLENFGKAYEEYRRKTPALVPFTKRADH